MRIESGMETQRDRTRYPTSGEYDHEQANTMKYHQSMHGNPHHYHYPPDSVTRRGKGFENHINAGPSRFGPPPQSHLPHVTRSGAEGLPFAEHHIGNAMEVQSREDHRPWMTDASRFANMMAGSDAPINCPGGASNDHKKLYVEVNGIGRSDMSRTSTSRSSVGARNYQASPLRSFQDVSEGVSHTTWGQGAALNTSTASTVVQSGNRDHTMNDSHATVQQDEMMMNTTTPRSNSCDGGGNDNRQRSDRTYNKTYQVGHIPSRSPVNEKQWEEENPLFQFLCGKMGWEINDEFDMLHHYGFVLGSICNNTHMSDNVAAYPTSQAAIALDDISNSINSFLSEKTLTQGATVSGTKSPKKSHSLEEWSRLEIDLSKLCSVLRYFPGAILYFQNQMSTKKLYKTLTLLLNYPKVTSWVIVFSMSILAKLLLSFNSDDKGTERHASASYFQPLGENIFNETNVGALLEVLAPILSGNVPSASRIMSVKKSHAKDEQGNRPYHSMYVFQRQIVYLLDDLYLVPRLKEPLGTHLGLLSSIDSIMEQYLVYGVQKADMKEFDPAMNSVNGRNSNEKKSEAKNHSSGVQLSQDVALLFISRLCSSNIPQLTMRVSEWLKPAITSADGEMSQRQLVKNRMIIEHLVGYMLVDTPGTRIYATKLFAQILSNPSMGKCALEAIQSEVIINGCADDDLKNNEQYRSSLEQSLCGLFRNMTVIGIQITDQTVSMIASCSYARRKDMVTHNVSLASDYLYCSGVAQVFSLLLGACIERNANQSSGGHKSALLREWICRQLDLRQCASIIKHEARSLETIRSELDRKSHGRKPIMNVENPSKHSGASIMDTALPLDDYYYKCMFLHSLELSARVLELFVGIVTACSMNDENVNNALSANIQNTALGCLTQLLHSGELSIILSHIILQAKSREQVSKALRVLSAIQEVFAIAQHRNSAVNEVQQENNQPSPVEDKDVETSHRIRGQFVSGNQATLIQRVADALYVDSQWIHERVSDLLMEARHHAKSSSLYARSSSQYMNTIHSLEKEVHNTKEYYEKQLTKLSDEIQVQFSNKANEYHMMKVSYDNRLQALKYDCDRLSRSLQEKSQAFDTKDAELAQKNAQYEELKQKNGHWKAEIESLHELVAQTKAAAQDAKSEQILLEESAKEEVARVSELSAKLQAKTMELTTVTSDLQSKEHAWSEAQSQVEETNRQLVLLAKSHQMQSEKITQSEKLLADATENVQLLSHKLDTMSRQVDEGKSQNLESRAKVLEHETEQSRLQNLLDSRDAELEQLRRTLAQQSKRTETLEFELAQQELRAAEIQNEVAKRDQQLLEKEQAMSDAHAEIGKHARTLR